MTGQPMPPELRHFGVKGMHWGVRHDGPAGVSTSTNRAAKKDAKEFARAKAFYGEGAGTRRKLIKQTVEGNKKKSPDYARAFDHHLTLQDTAKAVDKARTDRRRKDVKKGVGKTIRGTRHVLNGNSQYASAAVAILAGGALYAHKAGIDKVVLNAGKTAFRNISGKNTIRAGMSASEFLKNMGVQ